MESWLAKRRRERRRARAKNVPRRMAFALSGVVVAGLICTGLVAWGSHADALRITQVSVMGTDVLSADALANTVSTQLEGRYVGLFARDNTLIYPKDTMYTALKNTYPRIAEVVLERDGRNKLLVQVEEYKPHALWCGEEPLGTEEVCYFIDGAGYIFARSPEYSGSVFFRYYGTLPDPTNPIGQTFLGGDTLAASEAFARALGDSGLAAHSLAVDTYGDFFFFLDKGGEVRLRGITEHEKKIRHLVSLMESSAYVAESLGRDIEYFDLRFDRKVLYKFSE